MKNASRAGSIDPKQYAIDELSKMLESKRARFREQLAEVSADPSRLEHVDVRLVAWIEILEEITQGLPEHTMGEAIEVLRQRVIHGARFPTRSTNQLSNLVALHRTSVAVELVETLTDILRKY